MAFGFTSRFMVATLACMGSITAHAATAWNETSNGDFSNNGLAPTAIALTTGSNHVIGTTGNSGAGVDRDYFTFTVPAGRVLTAIVLLNNTYVSGGASFVGLQAGPQLTVSPSGAGAEQLIGFMHYSGDLIGSDVLPLITSKFPHGLSQGAYSVWVQETGGPVEYGFDFVLSPLPAADVPTLPEWAMILLGALLFMSLWHRDRQSSRAY